MFPVINGQMSLIANGILPALCMLVEKGGKLYQHTVCRAGLCFVCGQSAPGKLKVPLLATLAFKYQPGTTLAYYLM